MLPQKERDHDLLLMKSYNVPEFITGPVTFDMEKLADFAKKDSGIDVTFKE